LQEKPTKVNVRQPQFVSSLQLTGGLSEPYSWINDFARYHALKPGSSFVAKKRDDEQRQVVGFVGLGLDNKDGHGRVTRSEHFFLIGGSQETHERMQDTAIRFGEGLRRKGKSLKETSVEEVIEIFHETKE
jgi:hypothetical protein